MNSLSGYITALGAVVRGSRAISPTALRSVLPPCTVSQLTSFGEFGKL